MPRRTPVITREQVADEHKAAYDEISAIRGRPPTVGPTSVLINSPEMAVRANRLSEYLGEQSSLSEKVRRLAGLIGARSMDCQFVWNAHCAAGRRAGLQDDLVDALRDKKPLPSMSPEDAAVVNYGMELTSTNQVSQETFQAALDQLGAQGLTEFTTFMGYYRMLALNANAFTIDLPDDMTETVLPV
jgi:4-carboxymuconolactone decarboxylase